MADSTPDRRDDSSDEKPTRAELEARLRILEEKRDRLLEDIASQRLDSGRGDRIRPEAAPARILELLEKTLSTVQPSLGIMTDARDMLITDRAEAERRNDTESASEFTKALDELSAQVVEFTQSIAKIRAAADTIRASLHKDGDAASGLNELG
jgi:hypothetical protein